jgi:site-specific DNA-cytosine methylase
MLKDQTMQPTLLQEDFHANLSALQEKEREQMMIATSGMKLLESLPNVNRGGLLEKMLKDLLTSTTAWSSDRCKLIWKIKVSKSNVLLFQLQASVLSTSVKESGLWLTPTATEMGARSEEALQKRKEYRSKIGRNTVPPGNLAEQVHYGMATTNMYPTPTSVQRPNEGNMRMMRKTSSSREHFKGGCNGNGRQGYIQSTWQGKNVPNSNNQRCEESNISKESNKQDIHSGKFDSTRTDKTWWEAQSELCGVPNGISFELDKDRSSRIKALGNSIVPQIARQLGLSIMEAELSG